MTAEISHRIVTAQFRDPSQADTVRRYRIVAEIGRGGMGVVFKAQDLQPPDWYRERHGDKPRYVAIKYLHGEILDVNDKILDRFIREARLAAELYHKRIVQVLGIGMDEEGLPLIVMEFVDGAKTVADEVADLRDRFAAGFRRDAVSGKVRGTLMPPQMLFPILDQLLEALEVLHGHEAQIVHRDLKPENLLFTMNGDVPSVKLMDFGIAKALEDVGAERMLTKLTVEGAIMGTPYYMAPEQITVGRLHPETKQPWGVDTWTDIWAFGVICYELVSGELPYYHDSIQYVVAWIAGDEPPRPIEDFVVDLHPAMKSLIDRCMSREPWERPRSATELRRLLAAVEAAMKGREEATTVDGDEEIATSAVRLRSEPAPPPDVSVSPPSEPGRKPIFLVAAVSLLAGVLVVLSGMALFRGGPGAADATALSSGPPPAPTAQEPPPPAEDPAPSVAPRERKRIPEAGPAAGSLASVNFERGVRAWKNGNCRSAEVEMHRTLAQFPAFPRPYLVIADCAYRSRKMEEAKEYARKYDSFEGGDPLPPHLQSLLPR